MSDQVEPLVAHAPPAFAATIARPRVTLLRTRRTPRATFGRMVSADLVIPALATLERPWLDNRPGDSCIMAAIYRCVLTHSPHLGYVTPELLDVPERSDIRIHILNRADQSKGCIGVGTAFGNVLGADGRSLEDGILNSRVAFEQLMRALAGVTEFELAIAEPVSRALGPHARERNSG